MKILTHASEDSFDRLIDHMGAMMDEMMSRNYFRSSGPDSWAPALNVYETADRYVICVDLAGMDRNKIDVRAEGRALRICGIRPKPALPDPPDEVSVHLMEIDSGRFHRKVPIPADTDRSGIRAQYRNGYLWLIMPRRDGPQGPAAPDFVKDNAD
ncbi:MAG: Hsp20/alpha crystallin family protein [Planctomycetota bacterium]|jgi:HSP20 family protein